MSIKSRILRTTYWINDFFKGSPVRSQYNDIRRVQEDHTVGQLLRKQWLSGILCHAVAHSAYYKGISPDSLSNFPVVNKSILKENYDRVKVPEKEIPGQEGAVHVQHTSGSTGTPFHVPPGYEKAAQESSRTEIFRKDSRLQIPRKAGSPAYLDPLAEQVEGTVLQGKHHSLRHVQSGRREISRIVYHHQ